MDTKQKLMELLAERAVFGLDAERSQELEALLDAHPEWNNDSFDLAAAAIDEALSGPPEPMPDDLRDRLLMAAGNFAATSSSSRRERGAASDGPAPGDAESKATIHTLADERARRAPELTAVENAPMRASSGTPIWAGWLAAAAALVIAALAWWPTVPVPGTAPATTVDERAALMADAGDTQRLPWQTTPDPAAVGATGDVVWSGIRQEGYMRIRGLDANDPALNQYQLWIFDAQRDERYPVDGGVFDMPANADEIIVPIQAKLPIDDPILFAITVERPGGVVVSARERIVLLAQEAAAGN